MADTPKPNGHELTELRARNAELVRNIELLLNFQTQLFGLRAVRSEEELFENFAAIVRHYIDTLIFAILEYEHGAGRIRRVRFSSGQDIDFTAPEVLDPTLIRWVATQRLLATEATPGEIFTEKGIRTVVLVPLLGHTKFSGILVMGLPHGSEQMSLFVETLINTFAREIGTVLENLSLHRELVDTHNLFENVIESVPHAILAVGPEDRIIAVNRNFEFLFGVKKFEALHEKYQDVLPGPVSETFSSLVMSTIAGHRAVDEVIEFEIEPGVAASVGISTSLLVDRSGRPHGLVFVCRDMTLSREVQKLRDLDAVRNEFVQTASHELKTPLTTIIGGVDILNMNIDKIATEDVEVVQLIESGARRLQDLVGDLLQITRLEAQDAADLEWDKIDLRAMMEDAVGLFAGSEKHSFKIEIPDDLVEIDADRDKLKQVIDNFVGNAVKYSPEGGVVTIRVKCDGEKVNVSVSDRGIGIPEDQLPYVWDKFFRANITAEYAIEGTGLGLSITKHLVELHGGEVWAESEHGKGSTFHFTIPIQREIS
ncbi:MAG: PAS domain S-box protein [Planctomycetota bacterium]|nr:MAG: PAS domain S-box protein [Planctomycetota bacterium]